MFDAPDLASLRDTQVGHMFDTAYVSVYSRTINSFGEPIEVWTDNNYPTVCGLDLSPGSERYKATMTLTEYDATIRFPITTVIDTRDRVRVTQRFGENITNLIFEVVAPVQRGPSGIRVLVNKIDN